MTMDHYAYCFLSIKSLQFAVFRFFGRMVAPVMCYLLTEGYTKSSSHRKYIIRMLVFALVGYVPYVLMSHPGIMIGKTSFQFMDFNMLFTLAICLIMLEGIDYVNSHYENTEQTIARNVVILVCVLATRYCDWHYYAALWVAGFYLYHDEPARKWQVFCLVNLWAIFSSVSSITARYGMEGIKYGLFCFGSFGALLLLKLNNHEKGKLKIGRAHV